MSLLFEWDEDKAEQNYDKYAVTFKEAMTTFRDPLSVTIADLFHSVDEKRFVTIGESALGVLLGCSAYGSRWSCPRHQRP